jgi:hypothetical protein
MHPMHGMDVDMVFELVECAVCALSVVAGALTALARMLTR